MRPPTGPTLVVLPEKFNLLGPHEAYLAGAETLDGPTVGWARDTARALGIDLVAGSFVERREDRDKLSNTSVHVGPDGELKAVYRKIHMFDVEVGGSGLPRVRVPGGRARPGGHRDRRRASPWA